MEVHKLDVISDGRICFQMLHFCQNTRLAFLTTPFISDIHAQVDATSLEVLCQRGTADTRDGQSDLFCW